MSSRFDIVDTDIEGLRVLQRKPVGDDRGFLERLYCRQELRMPDSDVAIAQINLTMTARRGTVRGLHFQYPPHQEIKFITCLRGEVFDVAVDLRRGSPTFLRWHAELLNPANHRTFVIPAGFAHGFQTLTDGCEMLYFHTAPYNPSAEGAVNPQDPMVSIAWPERITELSARDSAHPMLTAQFSGLEH